MRFTCDSSRGMMANLLRIFCSTTTGVSVAEHDWHHEKFLTNYSLSFKYLDKVFGTYHPGRVPGEQKGMTAKAQ